jgi:hypothetical protein
MKHRSRVLVFLVLVTTGALAQDTTPSPGRSAPATGAYSGTVQEWGGADSSDVKLNIRDITRDGRVTGRVLATYSRKGCAKNLPLNGIVLPDGGMRLEVDAGAPEGCQRMYNVKVESGTVSGTYIDAVRSTGRRLNRR